MIDTVCCVRQNWVRVYWAVVPILISLSVEDMTKPIGLIISDFIWEEHLNQGVPGNIQFRAIWFTVNRWLSERNVARFRNERWWFPDHPCWFRQKAKTLKGNKRITNWSKCLLYDLWFAFGVLDLLKFLQLSNHLFCNYYSVRLSLQLKQFAFYHPILEEQAHSRVWR